MEEVYHHFFIKGKLKDRNRKEGEPLAGVEHSYHEFITVSDDDRQEENKSNK